MNEPTEIIKALPSLKWEEAINAGFQIAPDILFRKQGILGLSNAELVVLLNITMHWWYKDRKPFPKTGTIAKRMDADRRTVQRAIKSLTAKELIRKEKVEVEKGKYRSVINLDGLVAKLKNLAQTDLYYKEERLKKLKSNLNEKAN